ncbi:MAG TPA: glycosyltransferase [Terriglobia bacterium]|nr:glycosyltransferase [Terriglobia bacterium]
MVPESLKRQNEIIRALQRELDNQKWVFEQFLRSPTWRITAPARWIARQLRALGGATTASAVASADATASVEELLYDPRVAIVSLYQTALQSFLLSSAVLRLPAAPEPDVSIIVVLYNRAELSFACLRSIAEYRSAGAEVIIVDNASTDETSTLLDRLSGARVIRNRENLHFLRAVNQAAAEARGRFLVLLNNDAQLLPGSLDAALETLESADDIGAVGGKVVFLDGSLQEAGSVIWRDGSCQGYGRGDVPYASQYMFRRDVDYCSGAFLVTPMEIWRRLGGFDEAYRPAYYEETDYCMRLRREGYRVVYEPGAVVLHHEFASAGSTESAIAMQRERQRIFVQRHQVALQSHELPGAAGAFRARARQQGPRVLFLDDQVPHLWLGSGFPRARAFLQALTRAGCFVTLYPLSVTLEDWNSVYSDFPREIEVMNDTGPDALTVFLKSRVGYYDTIIVSRPHNMERFSPALQAHPDWFSNSRVIYDAEALFTDREAGLRRLRGVPMSAEELREKQRSEVELSAGADTIVAVSEADRAVFAEHGAPHVTVLGHAITPRLTARGFDERAGILFVGAVHEEESPNGDSLIWFLSEAWPLIQRQLGKPVAFTIAGVNRSARIRELALPPARLVGGVPDLSGHYEQARVFVAPTRYAAGIPQKVHEAAARGVPVVATSLLARQLGWGPREIAIADTAEDFAARVTEIHSDADRWARLRAAAFERVVRECSEEAFDAAVRDLVQVATTAPPKRARA